MALYQIRILRRVQDRYANMDKMTLKQASSSKAPLITTSTTIPTMSFLKNHALLHLDQSHKWEKIHVRREATATEGATLSPNQRQTRTAGSDNKVYISEWLWRRTPSRKEKAKAKLAAAPEKVEPPKDMKRLVGQALQGMNERPTPMVRRWLRPKFGHLNRRRQRSRRKVMARLAHMWRGVTAAKLLHQIEALEAEQTAERVKKIRQ